MEQKKNITGIILAGGKSTRMGVDKGMLLLNGIYFTQHIIDNLTPLVDEIIIVSNNEKYDLFKVKRIPDYINDFGPVAAIYTGLIASKSDYNFIVSCDAPKVNAKVLEPLLKEINNGYEMVQYIYNNKETPLTALYHQKCLPFFKFALKNNVHKLRFVTKQLNSKTIIPPRDIEKRLINLNTPKDLEKHNIC